MGRFITLFEKLITKVLPQEIQPIYQDALGNVFFFQDEADKPIESLKKKGYSSICCNEWYKQNAVKENEFIRSGQVDGWCFYFRTYGYPKPKKEYFDACLRRWKEFPEQNAFLSEIH